MSRVNSAGEGKSYSVKPENLNLDEYKNLLFNKLKDSLEIAGFDAAALELQLIEPNMINHMVMPSCGVAESMTSYTSVVSGANPVAKYKVKENMSKEIQQSQKLSPKAKFVDLRNVQPFVKWLGGKGQLLPEFNKMIPSHFNTYFEPFLGGGALFFYMMSRGMRFNACLSDTNGELITAYNAIKANPKGVIELLQRYEREYKGYQPYSKEQQEYYLQLRDARNKNIKSSNDVEIAGRCSLCLTKPATMEATE